MTKWELRTWPVNITKPGLPAHSDPYVVWTDYDKEGKTAWDRFLTFADEGWELVSVTPIITTAQLGITGVLLYTFKRPKPE